MVLRKSFFLLFSACLSILSLLILPFNSSAFTNNYSDHFHTSSLFIVINHGGENIRYSDTTFHIIPAVDHTFGYEILIGKKVLIKQTTIPSMPGVKGFKSKSDAQKVALLMIHKLKKRIMPPTTEKKELDKLKIHF